jgi:hypothetical protein
MSQVITKRSRISRRRLLRGFTLSGGAWVGLPPLVAMFNSAGSAYAAEPTLGGKVAEAPIESRFVLWFNGNGIPERYWIPAETRRQLQPHTLSRTTRSVPKRHARNHRPRQFCRRTSRTWQRPSQLHEWFDDVYAVYRTGRRRSVD